MSVKSLNLSHQWRNTFSPHVINFDKTGDGVYASKKTSSVNMTLTTNPFGCSSSIEDSLIQQSLSAYPFNQAELLKAKIAHKLNISDDHILLGNGIDGLMFEIARALLSPSCQIVVPKVTFPNMSFAARVSGAEIAYAEMKDHIFSDLESIRHCYKSNTKLSYLCNPNNPTGEYLSPKDIIYNLYSDESILIVDEANIEFSSGESCVDYIHSYPNLVVLRTFSKAYGIAGLRIGYIVADSEFLRLLDRSRPPFPVSGVACDAANKAITDNVFLESSIHKIFQEKEKLVHVLEQFGFTVFDGKANTILCHHAEYDDLITLFQRVDISVTAGSFFGLKDSWCRIAPQSVETNNDFIKRLETL
ncbi:histidinol-phosphate aminotransferase family protein [Marinomonas agarivorans]|nr:histidinol-phosphate aminotransferase family protein [Marinomonas agarivorans]